MVDKIEGLDRGDLVELVLTADATRHLETHYWYAPDWSGETNIPGRVHSGYVTKVQGDSKKIQENYIFLAEEWNKVKNRPEMGATKFYFDAIDSYRKR